MTNITAFSLFDNHLMPLQSTYSRRNSKHAQNKIKIKTTTITITIKSMKEKWEEIPM